MKLKNKILTLFTFICLSTQAHAGFMVEPYVGFGLAGGGDSGAQDLDHSGLVIGGRAALTYLGFWIGGEYSIKSGFDIESTNNGITSTTEFDQSAFGVSVGYNLPAMFRVYGSYFLSSKLEQPNGTEFTGTGLTIGAGWTGLPFVSLNVEYRTFAHDEFESSPGTPTAGNLANDFNLNEIMVSVSLPLDF